MRRQIPVVYSGAKVFMSPNAYIISGPNGVGKTTFAREFLPHYADCKNFINADLIAQGMSPFSPETAAFHAGRIMLGEISLFAKRGADFGFETTLSGRGHLHLIRQLKNKGYAAHFFFGYQVSISPCRGSEREYLKAAITYPKRPSVGGLAAQSGISSVTIVGLRIHGVCSTIQARHPFSSPLRNKARPI
jgi:hypothetical protein